MQTGIGFSDYEIKQLIANEASKLAEIPADMLKVHISAGYGNTQACVVHLDGESSIEIKDAE